MTGASSSTAAADRIGAVSWYHSVPLPGGVVTPGSFDNQGELASVPLPVSLAGKRCLDVATADGFWAFEMERRGAAEVIAIDVPPGRLDWPAGRERAQDITRRGTSDGFAVAHELLGSKVQWRELSAYELDPSEVGHFDFVFAGSVLVHLRDPVRALTSIRRVLRGELLSVDAVSLPLTLCHPRRALAGFEAATWPLWWVPNHRAYRAMFAAAGLEVLESGHPFFVKRGPAYKPAMDGAVAGRSMAIHRRLKGVVSARLGNLHAWVRAVAR